MEVTEEVEAGLKMEVTEEVEAGIKVEVTEKIETAVKSDLETEVKEEVSSNMHNLGGAVPLAILNAAFAEDDEDPSDAGQDVTDPEEDK